MESRRSTKKNNGVTFVNLTKKKGRVLRKFGYEVEGRERDRRDGARRKRSKKEEKGKGEEKPIGWGSKKIAIFARAHK